jgi:transposase-like protein
VSARRAEVLRGAADARSLAAEKRARRAVQELQRRGATITFQAVAAEAGVSRAFLYGHRQLRTAIEQLRQECQDIPPRLPAHHRASEESTRARLRGMLEENKRLRAENAQLREELALAHGRVRELEHQVPAGRRR